MKTPNRFVTLLAAAATIGALIAATFPQYQTVALIAGTIAAVATALGRSLFPDEFPQVPAPPPTQPPQTRKDAVIDAASQVTKVILRGRRD